ncbi:glycosyltransferase [Actinomyces slackii]|uniref:Uncharacterized protein conserved in bacteria n=1 Tax=Actinomyces slackii TaxID=52774 RepID=A0A3S4SV60_9ACTO|nr:glycosyltransferase [Actinomyces slackii]VEG75884.1 Uncharacterized protein conserved in bacteria [Actinomyces slackii]
MSPSTSGSQSPGAPAPGWRLGPAARRPWMVFHAPYPLDPDPTSASRLRPLRMRAAFSEIGYEVFDLSGTVPQRRRAFAALRARLDDGQRPAFHYMENSTQPNALATSLRSGVAPHLEQAILAHLRRAGVPLGVFYRDAYWRTPMGRSTGLRGLILPLLQRADLRGYRRKQVHFFLPSQRMAGLVGLDETDFFSALPPAGDEGRILPLPQAEQGLRLLYVGGLGAHYDLTEFLTALPAAPSAHLDLVTRAEQWQGALAAQPALAELGLGVHHLSSSELAPLYAQAHVGVLAVKPSEYRDIAVPVKLFEYLSYGRPVIATRGTEAGRIIEANGAGWVVDHNRQAFIDLLRHLEQEPGEVRDRAEAARAAAAAHTWAARARQAALVLAPQSLALVKGGTPIT